MSGGKGVKYFWRGTEEDLHRSGVRIPRVVEYLMDQQPVWIVRSNSNYWENRHGLLTMVDNSSSSELYCDFLSEMRLPKKFLVQMERRFIKQYGNDRLKGEMLGE